MPTKLFMKKDVFLRLDAHKEGEEPAQSISWNINFDKRTIRPNPQQALLYFAYFL